MRFFVFLSFLLFVCTLNAEPLSVLIIGGGPCGLATAIEAHESGAHVVIVEKRSSYLRDRAIFLRPGSLKLLEKWKVVVPELRRMQVANSNVGLVLINELERGLAKRVTELGIEVFHGQFKDFDTENRGAIVVTPKGEQIVMPYDVLVGADGYRSVVRDKLDIYLRFMGSKTGAFAQTSSNYSLKFSLVTHRQPDMFVRKFIIPPSHSVILAQSISDCEEITQEQLGRAAWNAGWYHEANLLLKRKANFFVNGFDVVLQQSTTYSDQEKRALLVGDSAAVASFFQSMGANFAFKNAVIAGQFFRNVKVNPDKAYYLFNRDIDVAADQLILDSLYLFGL